MSELPIADDNAEEPWTTERWCQAVVAVVKTMEVLQKDQNYAIRELLGRVATIEARLGIKYQPTPRPDDAAKPSLTVVGDDPVA